MTRRADIALGAGLVLLCTMPAAAGTVEGEATIGGRPAVGAVVYLEARNPHPPSGPPARATMDQQNLAFVPEVLPVVRGTHVDFINSDDVQHNVFSPSEAAGKFNLGTYGPGASRAVTLEKTGDVIVLCNIHMEMEAHILVLDGPHFTTVAEGGRYRIEGVPVGAYTLRVWRGRWLTLTRSLEVPPEGTLVVDIAATE